MVAAAVKVYGEGKKELSKDQFATLLVDILTDISDRLASNPVVLASSATVCNGSKLKKVGGTFVSSEPAWSTCTPISSCILGVIFHENIGHSFSSYSLLPSFFFFLDAFLFFSAPALVQ